MESKYKILVVDDEEVILNLIEAVLSNKSYIVTKTNNSEEAMVLISLNKYDLMITDLDMPIFNGFEIIAKVRKINPGTAIILISGSLIEKVPKFITFLQKPFDINNLISAVKEEFKKKSLI